MDGCPESRLETVIVIAKEPVAGRVKTRLVPPLTYEQAAAVASASLSDTIRTASLVAARHHLLAFEGCSDVWLGPGWRVTVQPAGGLDARLASAFAAASSLGPAILVGMDTPQVRPAQLTAFDPSRYDACLGLAEDGGYWAIGFRSPALAALTIPGVPMSQPDTGVRQLQRLRSAGLTVQMLDELADVDTYDVACEVAGSAPSTDFAKALSAIGIDQHATVAR